jgi:hypothetical protein
MAKQLLRTYVFAPGTATNGTISVPGKWDLNQLLIVTNITKNIIIYNFADIAYNNTTVTFSRANTASFPQALQNTDGVTTFRLGYDTSAMSATDSLQIFVERNEIVTRPWSLGTDAFERTRMAAPQSMLDADFEYGLQPTKWQTLSMVRGYPGIYEIPGTDLSNISSITTDYSNGGSVDSESLITVTCSSPHNLSTSTPITVKALLSSASGYARAEGSFVINAVTGTNIFNYYAKARVGSAIGETISSTYTQIRKGGFYTGASIGTPTFTVTGSGASTTGTVTVSFAANHGLVPGNSIYVAIGSDNGSNNNNLCQGPFYISTVTTGTSLVYMARSVGSITGTVTGTIYVRSDSFYVHRPYDGGVSLGNGGPQHGAQSVRMSKKYIRYQSGKAINYNTGGLFAPNYDIRSLTASGTTTGSTVTVVVDDVDHGLQVSAVIQISGVTSGGYNGTYTVAGIVDERTFLFFATNTLDTTTAILDTPCLVSLVTWSGSTVRAGTFDEQNGMFIQYDGQVMALGLRTSTLQLAGTISVIPDSNLITGTNTRFRDQLIAGDRIVIRGMTHVVSAVNSQTSITITPDYRGVIASTGVKAVKTRDIIIPQSQWNNDRCDGTNSVFNPSGYNLIPNKMQMIGLQWTWYGAGFIDYMLRGPDGNYLTMHRIKNSNVNNEAYMRTGNMPVRYEVTNEGARSTLTTDISSAGTVMTLTDVTYFANSGTIMIDNEIIPYTAKTTATNQLTLGARGSSFTQWVAGQNRTFSGSGTFPHTSGTGVIVVGQTASPVISHWGSAFLTDGGFDNDRGYIFNYAATNIAAQIRKTTAFAIRLAPSVSNAITGDLGVRELINRAQLLLQGIEITAGTSAAGQALIIEGILNPSNYPSNTNNISWTNLTSSGQPSFSQVAAGNTITFDNVSTGTLNATGGFPNQSVITVVSTASVAIGDAVYNGNFLQGGTVVTSIGASTITVSQPLISVANGNFNFGRNQYANPGEQIFSFISSPQSKDGLDLTPLKELTNTPIVGRGAYPNGPDVLMINVYVTQGSAVNANLVLRWGEAQA